MSVEAIVGGVVMSIFGITTWVIKNWITKQADHNKKLYELMDKYGDEIDELEKKVISNYATKKELSDREQRSNEEYKLIMHELTEIKTIIAGIKAIRK